jgi:hypothetical protein
VLHVIGRDLYDGYRGRLKPEPTTGTDQIPASQPRPPEPGEQHTAPPGGTATAGAEDAEAAAAMSDHDPARIRLGSHQRGPARH